MAARIRNDFWKDDETLKETLQRYVKEGLQREEILDFVRREFEAYAWSMRTLDRRLNYFDIKYTDHSVTIDEIKGAVEKELQGPGKLLGYRALQKKIRQVYDLNVPRDVVYAVMYDVDSDALERRAPQFKKKRKRVILHREGPTLCTPLTGMTS